MQKTKPMHSGKVLRHIRRYILAPEHRMAAIVPFEFSDLCKQELYALGIKECSITEPGVEFSTKLISCFRCNLWLRTASRILCRVAHFRAGAVEELYQKVSVLRWELWLNTDILVRIEPYIGNSRIQHPGLVAKTVLEGLEKRAEDLQISPPIEWKSGQKELHRELLMVQRIIVHIRNNHCEISLDTSGTHLHQRGYRLLHTGAPLRETLAAAILLKSEWDGSCPLVDGMCGAGTVPIEASLLARRLPPGLRRSFLFEKWPAFQQKTWSYLRRKALEEAFPQAPVPIIAIDRDPEAVAVARQNARLAGVEADISWQDSDFFSFRPQSLNLQPGLLFLNPPYGKRLPEDKDLFKRLGVHLRRFYGDWRVAIMAPDRAHALHLQLRRARYWQVKHGGMSVVVALGRPADNR
jgi:putative N6-adenine-specific DNA methylase